MSCFCVAAFSAVAGAAIAVSVVIIFLGFFHVGLFVTILV